jgi:hypothetical protein
MKTTRLPGLTLLRSAALAAVLAFAAFGATTAVGQSELTLPNGEAMPAKLYGKQGLFYSPQMKGDLYLNIETLEGTIITGTVNFALSKSMCSGLRPFRGSVTKDGGAIRIYNIDGARCGKMMLQLDRVGPGKYEGIFATDTLGGGKAKASAK